MCNGNIAPLDVGTEQIYFIITYFTSLKLKIYILKKEFKIWDNH